MDAEDEGRIVAHFGDKEWQPLLKDLGVVVALGGSRIEEPLQHHLQRVLDAGYAARGVEIAFLFALPRVGGVVGGNGVDEAVHQSAPEADAVIVALDGGVAFDKVA